MFQINLRKSENVYMCCTIQRLPTLHEKLYAISLGTSREIVIHYMYSDPTTIIYEPVHEIPNNVVCATSKVSDQPAHTRSLIRIFASRLSIL